MKFNRITWQLMKNSRPYSTPNCDGVCSNDMLRAGSEIGLSKFTDILAVPFAFLSV